MFFGYLAGNKTYTKALAVQKDYAASLDKTAKSTKKATKAAKDYLSPLDEINRYTTNKDTDTTPSGSGANGTPISKMFDKLVKFCKEARGEDLVLLLRAAVLTNEDIAAELFTCLKLGIGYEVIYKKHWIPMQRKDFQGYRRKTLETVERLLLMRDIEMEE